ncbi:Calcium-activated chloride channel regulator 2 [Nymphon striatum]|nr:Calcium-activated chloride channel regulator 2 [Nymphon striatum]
MKGIIITLISVAVFAVQGEIKLTKDNGYEGITIVVENHQEQHEDFFPALKLLLQNASNFLYSSTGQVAYFGNVTVVIPSHWDLNKTESVTFVDSPIPLTAGDIRIDFPNPTYENEPYTLQPRGCSEPGNYIHMTMDFILNVNGTMQEDFGYDLGRQLVHEWAHFRYGVFDEYGGVKNKQYAQFYIDGDDCQKYVGIVGNRMNSGMVRGGFRLSPSRQVGTEMEKNDLAENDCKYIVSGED